MVGMCTHHRYAHSYFQEIKGHPCYAMKSSIYINLIVYVNIYYTSKYRDTRYGSHLPIFIVTLSHVTKMHHTALSFPEKG